MTTPSSPISPFIADQIHAMLLGYSKKIPATPARVLTLNLPKTVIARLQQFYAGATIESLTCKDLPDSRFTLADESVDLIIANFLQSYPVNPAVLFSDAKRILTRNGVFIFATFDSSSRAALKKVMANVSQTEVLDEKQATFELSHISFFRFSSIKERIVINAETREAIYCDIFVVSNPKIHAPLKSVMDALFMDREESIIQMEKKEGDEQEDAHEHEEDEMENEQENEVEGEREEEHEAEHELEHEEEHETEHEQEHEEEHETEHEQEHEEEHETEHEQEHEEEHETEHEQEHEEEHETEHEQEHEEEHETEHEQEHEEEHETEHEEENDTEEEQESEEEHEDKEEHEAHEEEQKETHHEENEKVETPEHKELAGLAHEMDSHKETLQSHASKLAQHLDNSAKIFKQLAEPGLSTEERAAKKKELQTRGEQHKEMLNTYKSLHDEHRQLLSAFLDSHEKALASNPRAAEKYHALIAKHLQLFSQHDEQIKQHEAFMDNMEEK